MVKVAQVLTSPLASKKNFGFRAKRKNRVTTNKQNNNMAFGYMANIGDQLTWARRSARRQIFHDLPSGPSSLVGILSIPEPVPTDNNEFEWLEKRFSERTVTLVSFTGADGPFMNGAAGGVTDATFEAAAGDTIRVRVSTNKSLDDIKVNDRITFLRLPTSTGFVDVTIQVVSVAVDIITALIINTISAAATGTLTNTLAALVTAPQVGMFGGAASAEGSLSGSMTRPTWPLSIVNYCSILRTPFSFSDSELQVPAFFDTNGLYPTTARDNCVDHHTNMENQVLFGVRYKASVTDTDGTETVRRTMGGISWFLQQYELSGGGTFGYRPGEGALTLLTDDKKRIWDAGATGTFTDAEWDAVLSKIFRKCFTSSHEKLLIGGDGIIAAINKKYKGQVQVNTQMMSDHKISFYLHTVETPSGTLHMKSHARFNELPHLRYDAFTLDIPNLKLRPLRNRDTKLHPNIHPRDFDGRKDEYKTEIGLECRYPESHGWLRNVRTITQA